MKTQRQPRRILLAVAVSFVIAAALWLLSRDLRGEWLRYAVAHGHPNRAKVLVWLGTDVNYATEDGTALHAAAANGNVELIHFFVRHGAIVDAQARFRVTPLAEAQMSKQSEAERVLVAYGAKPVPKDLHVP